MDDLIRKECAERRTKNHNVRIAPAKYGDYDKEACLQVTHNGFQWDSICLSETEAKKVINELSTFFNLGIVA